MRTVVLHIGLISIFLGGSAELFAQSSEDCRFKVEEVKPLIKAYNPFFADHEWDQENRVELARISNSHFLMITQDGCRRHHTRFNLMLDPRTVQLTDSFWIAEAIGMFQKVYFEQQVLDEFQYAFLEQFEEKFRVYGINRKFNFPVGTRNFICNINYAAGKGASIDIEMIAYLFKERVVKQRVNTKANKKGIQPDRP